MKNLTILFVLAFVALTISSCGPKDYTCTCTQTTSTSVAGGGTTSTSDTEVITYKEASKHDASVYCLSWTTTDATTTTPVVTTTQTRDCTLD